LKTLDLQLSAPIASFGTTPRLQHRLSQPKPTHSAIVGLICCAMGLGRSDDFGAIKSIKMRVLELSHGEPFMDFQTIRDAVTVDGTGGRDGITYRHNFPDYYALVEIKGDDALIDTIESALKRPKWQLYLGRRSNVLNAPVVAIKNQRPIPSPRS
jgi:CRISPR system Cascade subunit CasD